MASFGASGAIVYATGTTIAPAYPTGITAGQMLVLTVASKDDTATHTAPAGWTMHGPFTLTEAQLGVASGIDVGPVKVTIYTKEAVGSETGTLSIAGLTSNVTWAQISRFTKANGSAAWGTSSGGGRDISGNTDLSFPTSNLQIQPGDIVFGAIVIPTDTLPTFPAAGTIANMAITPTLIGSASSTSGRDIGGRTQYFTAPSTATGAGPTYSTTLSGTVTNAYGVMGMVALREIVPPSTPPAPTVTPGEESVTVGFSQVAGSPITAQWSDNGGSSWNALTSGFTGVSYTHNGADPTKSYTYRAQRVNAAGSSGFSASSSAAVPNPGPPLAGVAPGAGKNTVTIYRRGYAAVYKVYRGLSGGARSLVYTSPSQVANGSFTWDDTGLTNDQAYDYHLTTVAETPTSRESAASSIYTSTPSLSVRYHVVDVPEINGWSYEGVDGPAAAIGDGPDGSGSNGLAVIGIVSGDTVFATFDTLTEALMDAASGIKVEIQLRGGFHTGDGVYVDIGAWDPGTSTFSVGAGVGRVANPASTGTTSFTLSAGQVSSLRAVVSGSLKTAIRLQQDAPNFDGSGVDWVNVILDNAPVGEIHTTTGSATGLHSTTATTSTVRTKTGSTQNTRSVTAATSTVRTKTGSTQNTRSVTAVTTTLRTLAANATGIRSVTRIGSSTRATAGNMTSVHTTTDVTDSVFPEIHTSTGSATRVGSVTAVTSKRAVTIGDATGVRSVTFVDSKRAIVAANAAGIRSLTAVTTTIRTRTGSTQRTGSVTWTTSTVRTKTGSTQRTGSVTATTTTLRTLAMNATRVGSTTWTGSSTRSTTGQMVSVHTVIGQTFGNGEIHTSTGTAAMLHTTLSTSSKLALSSGNAPGVRTVAATTTTRRTTAANASGVRSLTSATSTRRTVAGSTQAVVSLTAATTTNRGTGGATSLTLGASGTVSTTRSSTGTAQVVLGVSWIVRGAFQHQWLLPGTAVLDTQPTATATLSPAGPATSVIVVTPAGTSTVTPEGPAVVVVTPEGPASAAIAPAGAATAILEPVAAGTAALTQE